MNNGVTLRCSVATLALAVAALSSIGPVRADGIPPRTVDQGTAWTADARNAFYVGDQGSQIMSLRWMEALKQPNGAPFLADSLNRYGYLPNDKPAAAGLPVGFTAAGPKGSEQIGMTCAACHTRQIDVGGVPYRIDGGPGVVDFQPFLADLDVAVNTVLTDDAAFKAFARAVLGGNDSPANATKLRQDVTAWFLRYDTLVKAALPKNPWGPSRLDAVAMIFDRLTGLDLGPPPSYLIASNIQVASAPVRYPFLWNAPIQDFTQWPGFAANGDDLLGLARNLGEVYGVFANFHPEKGGWFGINYLKTNSANFKGLRSLETLIKKLGPPKWPWALDPALVAQGKVIYERTTDQGGCTECHGIAPGKTRFFLQKTWKTPILNVGTDTREYQILAWTAQSGVLNGARILFGAPLQPVDKAFSILGTAVLGSIIQNILPLSGTKAPQFKSMAVTPQMEDLQGAFTPPTNTTQNAYESRVLQGIWAAAPYLHNGSVPTLAELLKPAAERVANFKIGPAYDIDNVGLAVEQTKFDYVLTTTGCDHLDSGDSRCGHEYGTTLPPAEKRALLEYLKAL